MSVALVFLTVVSMLTAIGASAVAWWLARDRARRSAVRVALLSAAIHGTEDTETLCARPLPANPMFSDELPPDGHDDRRPVVAIAIVLAVIVAIAAVTMVRRTPRVAPATVASAPHASGSASPARTVLELRALSHKTTASGLIITGQVTGGDRQALPNDLAAVVLLFDAAGAPLGQAQAPLDARALFSETGTSFTVTASGSPASYRLSFRSGDTIVPHVDRRDGGAAGTGTRSVDLGLTKGRS
jgi:hypothetical protein